MKAIKYNLKESYDKQNRTLVVISNEIYIGVGRGGGGGGGQRGGGGGSGGRPPII